MAGPTVKEILLKWGIDNSNWKKAIQELSVLLEKANKQADLAADKATKRLEAQKAKLKEYIADQKSETTELEKQTAQLKLKAQAAAAEKAEAAAKLASEKAFTNELTKQIAQQKLVAAGASSAKAEALAKAAAERAAATEIAKQIEVQKLIQQTQRALQQEVNSKLMQEKLVTAEIQKQTADLRKQITEKSLQKKITSGAVIAAATGIPSSQAAAIQLRLALANEEKMSTAEVVAERRKIVNLVDKEIAGLRSKGSLTASETTQLNRLISLRQQQVRAIAAEASKQKEASASSKAMAEMNYRLAMGELHSKKAIAEEHKRIIILLDKEIAQMRAQGTLNAQQVTQLEKLISLRSVQARMAGGGGRGGHGGGGHGGGMFGGGLLGGIMGGMFGGGPFGMIAGAVVSAEGFIHAIELATEKLKEFTKEVGPLQQVREQFEKLAPARGINNPIEFIDKLKDATHGLVDDMDLYRNANTFMQSSIHASSQDILDLTKATVGLARAQGKDATQAVQALNRFFLTGRSQTLAYVTGINRMQLSVGQAGRSMDEASRTTLQFKQALEVIKKQFEAIGEPAETYTEKLQKLGIATYDLMEEFTLGLQRSSGFKVFLSAIDDLVLKIRKLAERAGEFGEKFGNVFIVVTNVFETVVSTVTAVAEVFGNLVETGSELVMMLMQMSPAWAALNSGMDGFVNKAHPVLTFFTYLDVGIQTAISGLQLFAQFLVTTVRMVMGHFQEAFDLIKDPTWSNFKNVFSAKKPRDEWKAFVDQVKKDNQELTDSVGKKIDRLMGVGADQKEYRIKFAAPTELFTIQQQEEAAKKLAKIQEEIAIQTSKIQLEQTQLRIKKEEELNQVLYAQGLRDYQAFMKQKEDLDKQEYEAKLKNLQDEYEARTTFNEIDSRQQRELAEEKKRAAAEDRKFRLADIENQRTQISLELEKSTKSPEEKKGILEKLNQQAAALTQMVLASERASNQLANAELAEVNAKQTLEVKKHLAELGKLQEEFAAKGRQRTEQEIEDEVKARQKMYDELKKLEMDRIALAKDVNEKEFQEGNINSDEYLQKRVEFIQQEYEAETHAAAERLAANKDSYTAQAEFAQKTAEAATKREKDLTQLTQQEWGIRTKAAEDAFNRVKGLLESQLKYASSLDEANPFATRNEQSSLISSLIVLEEKRLQQQQKELKQTQELSADWFDVRSRIAQTQDQLVKYNQELVKTKDYSNSVVGIARKLSDVSALFPKGGKTAEGFGKFAQVFEQLAKLNQDFQKGLATQRAKRAGKTVKPVTPEEIFAALQKVSNETGESLKTLESSMKDASQTVRDMTGSMASGVDYLASKAKATAEELEKQIKSTSVPALDTLAQAAKKAAENLEQVPEASTEEEPQATPETPVDNEGIEKLISAIANAEGFGRKGAIPTERRNPGDLKNVATGEISTFSTIEEGFKALRNQLSLIASGKSAFYSKSSTLEQVGLKWSGGDPNWAQNVAKSLGVSIDTKLSEIMQTDKKAADLLNEASQKLSQAADKQVSAAERQIDFKGGTTPGTTRVPSGPSTSIAPRGTITESDKQDLEATMHAGSVPGGDWSQVAAYIGDFGASLGQASTTVKVFSGVLSPLKEQFQNILGSNGLFGGIKDIFKGKQDEAGDKLTNAMNGVLKTAGAVGGLLSAAKGEGGPFAAAMGGAASGMQLGSMFGPIGMAIGGGAGLLTGLFSGKARAAAEKIAKEMVAKFNAALQNLNSGTQTLSATIQLEIQNIQNAVSRLSGKKGGRDQLKNILPGMEQQLAQLQQQQRQIIQTFDEQLNVLNAPQAYQDQLNNVTQIIDKYQQYIQAGGNVANANEYLRQSFANLVQNGLNELNQSEQDAINNALQYNDLLVQKQQLIIDTNQQMQEIMSQGVAVRQMPEGVSRAIQLQKLAYSSQKQMDELNEQISVSKYKLDNESKIFDLATTRIGLENQLVILQNEQTDQDMKRIVALGNVVGAFQKQLPTSSQAALQELGLGAAYVSPLTEPSLVPTPPVKTGIKDIDLQNQLEYQQALAAYNLQKNYPIGYIPTTGPLPTTSPIPSTIGLPTSSLTGSSTYLPSAGVAGTASSMLQSSLALAQSSAAAVQQLNANWNSSFATIAAPLQTLSTALTQPSLPDLTVNGQQVDTISTTAGRALLVSPAQQDVTIPIGPGTTQKVGIIGTATQVAQATTGLFNSLSGASTTAKVATVPGSTTLTSPVAVGPQPVAAITSPQSTVNVTGRNGAQIPVPVGMSPSDFLKFYVERGGNLWSASGSWQQYQKAQGSKTSTGRPASHMIPVMEQHTTSLNSQVQTALKRHSLESNITQMSNMRTVNEAQLVRMKMQEIHADMARVQAHHLLIDRIGVVGSRTTTLEGLMQNVYETRGRQGFGKFYGEIASPT